MKRLLSLLAIFPAVYAEPLFQNNAMGSAFNSIMSQISPAMANYLYTFILVFAVSQFALSLIQPGDNAQRNSAAIAAALGLGSAFFVYITGFNAIGASIPFIVFIIVGVLSLMVWNVYQQFGNAGAAWVSSGIASIGLMIIGGIMHNIGTQITYYSELTGQDLSSSMTLSVLGMLAPYFILGGVLGLILSAIMAYRALFPGGGGGGPVPPGPPGGGGGGGGQQQQQQGGGGQQQQQQGGGGQQQQQQGGGGQQQQQQQMMLIQQLMPLLVAYNNVQNQQNIQQLVNALNIQQNVNQVINQPINTVIVQQLLEQLNQNQPQQNNDAILHLVLQLLTNLGQPVTEIQVAQATIVTPSRITLYRGVIERMKLNVMVPKGSQKKYFLQFKNMGSLNLTLETATEKGIKVDTEYGPFTTSFSGAIIILPQAKIPLGEQEFIVELTDENHKVIQVSKTKVTVVSKEDKAEETSDEERDKNKIPPAKITINGTSYMGKVTSPISIVEQNGYSTNNLNNREFKLSSSPADSKVVSVPSDTGQFTPDKPGAYLIELSWAGTGVAEGLIGKIDIVITVPEGKAIRKLTDETIKRLIPTKETVLPEDESKKIKKRSYDLYRKLNLAAKDASMLGDKTLTAIKRLTKLELIYVPDHHKAIGGNDNWKIFENGLDAIRVISKPDRDGRFINLEELDSNIKGLSLLVNTFLPSGQIVAAKIWRDGQKADDEKGQALIKGATETEIDYVGKFKRKLNYIIRLVDQAKEVNGEILRIIQKNPVRVEGEEIGPGIHREEE